MKKHDKSLSNKKHTENTKDHKTGSKTKKPFNKKKYRLQKYSNKFKVQQQEDLRKKAILRNFYKDLSKDERKQLKQQHTVKHKINKLSPPGKEQKNPFQKAKQEFLGKKQEKKRLRDEALRRKAEKEEALKNYKERKVEAYKKLSKKTKKGQPVMKDRLEMLLAKIEGQASCYSK